MAMGVAQVRLPKAILEQVDALVESGDYASKSDVFREGIRKLIHEKVHSMVGIIPNTGDSVKEIRAIRKKLSKEKFDIDKINSLLD
ncbi:MAG: ribbon-helix-helix domain-containing protein [Candidatus Nanoarchaeia archaeon]|nr:ribbon-helix-helix domain-containing protein [Candidatus Nanoarchaeia archaeon]